MTTLQMLAQDLVKGDTIAVHPKTKARGDWIADGPAVLNGKVAKISVTTPEGMSGQIVVGLDTKLEVRGYGRGAQVAGLRRLAQFLEDHPELPDGDMSLSYFPRGDGELFEEVDRVAGVLGVEPNDDVHYTAKRDFGGRVSYEAIICERKPAPAKAPSETPAVADAAVQA